MNVIIKICFIMYLLKIQLYKNIYYSTIVSNKHEHSPESLVRRFFSIRASDSPAYRILHNPTSTRSEVSCCEKNNPPSSTVVDIDEGSKSSDDLENEYDGIQNFKTTNSDIVGGYETVKKQNDTLTLQFV